MRAIILAFVTRFLVFVPRYVAAGNHGDHEKRHGKHHGSNDDNNDRDDHGRYGEACFRDGALQMNYDYGQLLGLAHGRQR